jgi:hypothetical protein
MKFGYFLFKMTKNNNEGTFDPLKPKEIIGGIISVQKLVKSTK